MVENQVAGIKTYLANASLHASPEWVEGCVEFFVSEHQDQGFTAAALKDFVLQQWKLADLREMGQGCLPPNLSGLRKTVLPGKYALQVEWIRNMGQPAYTQVQDIRKQRNENTEVGATLPQTWEPRPTRMLQLALCDGIQNIKGIEYRSIMSLNEQLLPGCKVLVVGPVEYRRGVLLLEQHNLEILGGEIDSLLIPNAIENVLARALNLELNPDPYKTQIDVNVGPQTAQEPVVTRNDFVQPPIQQNPTRTPEVQVGTAPIQNAVCKPPSSGRSTNQVSRRNSDRRMEEELLCEDDFMLEAEMDAQLSVLEREYQEELENTINNQDLQTKPFEKIEFESLHNQQTTTYSSEREFTAESDTSHLMDDDDDILLQMSLEALEKPKTQGKLQEDQHTCSGLTNRLDPQTEHHAEDLMFGQCSKVRTQRISSVKSQTRNITMQSKITSFLNKSVTEAVVSSGSQGSSSNTSEANRGIQRSLQQCGVQVEDKQVLPNLGSSSTSESNENFSAKLEEKSVQPMSCETLIQTAARNAAVCTTPIVTDSYPFVYLSQVKIPVKSRSLFTIKAFVMTLLSQMTYGKDGWHLLVKLCDGSKNLDAKLSSDVLEKLMGFSRAEVCAMRQKIPNNPLLKEKLKNILQNTRQQLIGLNCLLDLEFLPEIQIPCVIKLTEITEQHLQALQARVKSVGAN